MSAYTGQIYESDDRKLFCRHCGRATWLHSYIPHVGYACRVHGVHAPNPCISSPRATGESNG